MNKIPVTIFEDNKNLRRDLEELISLSNAFFISGSYADAEDLVKKINESEPNVILMDIQMPGISGIEAVKILNERRTDIPVIMLTVFEDIDKIFAAVCNGASGYLLKNTSAEKIIEALHDALVGGSPMTPSIARKVLTMVQDDNKNMQVEIFNLTAREKEVLHCLMKGLSFKMIAAELKISFETVRSHMKNIYAKLHVQSLQEAVSKAFKSKLF